MQHRGITDLEVCARFIVVLMYKLGWDSAVAISVCYLDSTRCLLLSRRWKNDCDEKK
jgi:hypothetical protein